MNLKPFNKRLIVSRTTQADKKDTGGFIIPTELEEEFSKRKEFELVQVVNKSDDCTLPVSVGSNVVVLSHMLEKIEIDDNVFLSVTENHVIGQL